LLLPYRRYILLLQELQKLTPPKHKDYKNIGRALSDIKQMTDFINRFKSASRLCRVHGAVCIASYLNSSFVAPLPSRVQRETGHGDVQAAPPDPGIVR
jgi:hypothetical protein